VNPRPPPWLLPLALGALAGLVAILATALWQGARAEANLARARRSTALRRELTAQVKELRGRVTACIEAWSDAEEDPDSAFLWGWARLQRVLGAGTLPIGTQLEIYEATREWPAEDEPPEDGVSLLGRASAVGFEVSTQETPLAPALPRASILSEVVAGDPGLAERAPLWFSLSGDDLRLHTLLRLEDEEQTDREEEGDEQEDVEGARREVVRLFHLAVPFRAPTRTRALVRCDLQDGSLVPALVEHVAEGSLGAAQVQARALPRETYAPLEGRHLSPDRTPRLSLFVPAADGPSLLLLGLTGLCLLGLLTSGLLFWRAQREARPHPPSLSGEAAHEMRTPLTVMRGKLEVALRREREPAQYRQTLRECLEEVEDLQTLQDAVLLLARNPLPDASQERVDLVALVAGEVQRVQTLAPERRIALQAPAAPLTVRGDPALLARAVANLLDNALLHSLEGGAISAVVTAGSRQVEIRIEDEGPGVPEERREAVFQRFYRGPDVGRRSIPGSGLGLAIVRWIALQHGGQVFVDPRAHQRGCFVLRLPLA